MLFSYLDEEGLVNWHGVWLLKTGQVRSGQGGAEE